jgi:hypothetical protein
VSDLFAWDEGALVRSKVVQCALSRICGVCGAPLGRPIAFVGTPLEIGRNAFHTPPLHGQCALRLLDDAVADPTWQVVTTAGFEFVRPVRNDADPQVRFEPNSLLSGGVAHP